MGALGDVKDKRKGGFNEHLCRVNMQLSPARRRCVRWGSVTDGCDSWGAGLVWGRLSCCHLQPPAPFLGSSLCSSGAGRAAHQAAADLLWMVAWHVKVNRKQGCWQHGLCGLSVIPLVLNLEWWCSDGFQWEHISAKAETITVWHEVFVGS